MADVPVRPSSSRSGLIFGIVLAVPFALVGTVLAYRVVWTVVSVTAMQTWPAVPATLEHVELQPDGQRTERVVATYHYAVEGRTFQGTRVSVYGADSIGGSQQTAYETLEGYRARGVPYLAHVNPKNPADAILMPELRVPPIAFMALFALLFGGLGWGFLGGGVRKLRQRRLEDRLAAAHPDEPWLQRVEWAGPYIKPDAASSAPGAVFAAVLWNLSASPVLLAALNKVTIGAYGPAVLLMVFPAIGLYLLVFAGIMVARARRFGQTYLELTTMPGRPGEPLRGRLVAPAALAEARTVELTAACVHAVRNANAESAQSKIRTTTVWHKTSSVPVLVGQMVNGAAVVPVDIVLPDHPDSSRGLEDWHEWTLSAVARLKGADLDVEFEVPVFRRRP